MSESINLYSTRVFSEHPNTLWSLDESADYISLIPNSFQDLSNWTPINASVVDATTNSFEENPPPAPFVENYVSGIIESDTATLDIDGKITIRLDSDININPSDVNSDLGSIAIGLYAFTYDRTVQARLGISYTNSLTGDPHEFFKPINIPSTRTWAFVSETFALPENFENLNAFIEFNYSPTELKYEIAVNGISFGQWTEEFNTSSLGVEPTTLPENLPISGQGIDALPYGLQGEKGYYLIDNNALTARNNGVPLVYGSNNSTIITPNSNGPSLILPGNGFMNQSGQYKPLTFEFWANIQSNALTDRRVFGPISSSDGIYVDRHLIKLKVGNLVGSHNIGQWGRPMLISIRLTYNSATMIINGEEVISLSLIADDIDYPEPINEYEQELDWVGFYSYADVPLIQIEAPAVYPYEVPTIVQKRRFVYGQGVEFPTSISGLNHASVVAVDYSVSNYTKNVSYPNTYPWSAGISENIDSGGNFLSLPEYSVPELFLNNLTEEQWKVENLNNFNEEHPYFSILPSSSWTDTEGYLYYQNMGFLQESPQSFFGVFESVDEATESQTLFRFEEDASKNALEIYLNNGSIYYSIEYIENNQVQKNIFYQCSGQAVGDVFVVGINFADAANNFGGRVATILGQIQKYKIFIGGKKTFENSFSGKIYRVTFSSSRNLAKYINIFGSNGLAIDYSDGYPVENNSLSQNGTYSLVATLNIGEFMLNVATDSYWENYLPLSYFGKYVTDLSGKSVFSLDFLQFNFDYVKLQNFVNDSYDTSMLPVKTYISFQYLADGANNSYLYYSNTKLLNKNNVVAPGDEWVNTKYEVLNDSVIKLPIGINFKSLAVVIHVEIESNGIISDNLQIRYLEVASQALGHSPNRINTKFGSGIIPYSKFGTYFDYKSVSPFTIFKESAPYLYLTKNSGIRLCTEYSPSGSRGLSIPINTTKSSFFKLDLLQMVLRYDENEFPTYPVQIFEIQSKTEYIKFFLVADSGTRKRGQIYAIDQNTGSLKSGIVYTIDGKVVKRPVLNINTWTTLGMSFSPSLNFFSYTGALRVTSPILFNNVSYYQTTRLDDIQRFAFRKWFAVRSGIDNPLDWSYWSGKDYNQDDVAYQVSDGFTWQEVLFLTETEPTALDPSKIYNIYTGTNSFIFDTESSLIINNYRSSAYKDLSWSGFVINPV